MKDNNNIPEEINTTNNNGNKVADAGVKIANKVVDNILDKGSKTAGSFVGKAAGAAATKALMPLILKIVLGSLLVGGIGYGLKRHLLPNL